MNGVTIEILPMQLVSRVKLRAYDPTDSTEAVVSVSPELSLEAAIKMAIRSLAEIKTQRLYKQFMTEL